jgi:hypothetical protein
MLIPHASKLQFALALADGAYGNRAHMSMLARDALERLWPTMLPAKELRIPEDDWFALVSSLLLTWSMLTTRP